jgi:AAA15 family ATPase/GTPase
MLDSLIVKNFRCLEDFSVERLGRVNLIVGKNNSGKSTVLEALRLYAGNAQRPLLEAISVEHDEKIRTGEAERSDPELPMPYQDFFTGRRFPSDDTTVIQIGGATLQEDLLRIEHVLVVETEEAVSDGSTGETVTRIRRERILKSETAASSAELKQALMISKGAQRFPIILLDRPLPRSRYAMFDSVGSLPCSTVATQFGSSDELADLWDKIVLTEHEEVVKQAMQIIAPEFENLTFVRNEDARNALGRVAMQRSARVKLSDVPRPVPLGSLGDGMLRVLQLALRIFPAKGGFLLIDEFENGLHYSVQERVWVLVFEMARRLDIQVFATTHSWDCIESFSKVARARDDVEGVLFRVGKSVRTSDHGRVIATLFDEEALFSITQSEAEVR